MKAHLLYADRAFESEGDSRSPGAEPFWADLGLDAVVNAMAAGDRFLLEVATATLPVGLIDPDSIGYRHAILADSLAHRETVNELYAIAVAAIEEKRQIWSLFTQTPDSRLRYAIRILEVLLPRLRRLRAIADAEHGDFTAPGWRRLFEMIRAELNDDYLHAAEDHLATLRFHSGLLLSATVGPGLKGGRFHVHRISQPRRGWRPALRQLWQKPGALTIVIPPKDHRGYEALTELRHRGVNDVANIVAQSADHILNFFTDLRRETAFYLGCCHLYDRLGDAGLPVCMPTAVATDDDVWHIRALYDPGLAVRTREQVVGNDLDGVPTSLLIITGANRGGKSTFLRALGLAQIMMQAGMFVAAEEFTARIRPGVSTHYKREEDATLRAGKLVEELSRMNDLVEKLGPGYLLLMNESFSSTNEAEGAEIAYGLVRGLLEKGVCIAYVTHSFELADRFGYRTERDVLFLRAGRTNDGERTFKLLPAAPTPTGYGEDLYRQIFGRDPLPIATGD
jgi:MutS domain V